MKSGIRVARPRFISHLITAICSVFHLVWYFGMFDALARSAWACPTLNKVQRHIKPTYNPSKIPLYLPVLLLLAILSNN